MLLNNMRILLFFTALFFWQCSYGQWFDNISTYTTQNGLSNNTITYIAKDDDGFLWIATHEGLNRYDGTEFINVLSNTKNNLPSNYITKICFISKTLMAVGTEDGLCLLNTLTLTGKTIPLPFKEKFSGSGSFIQDILYNKKTGELWVGTWHGLFVLNKEGNLQKKMIAEDINMNEGFFARNLFLDEKGSVYFFCQQKHGFYYPDFENHKLIPVEKRIPDFTQNDFIRKGYLLRSSYMLDHESICIFSKGSKTINDDYIAYRNLKTGRDFIDKLSVNDRAEKRTFDAFPLNDSIFLVNSYFGEPFLYNSNSHELKPAADHPLWFASWPDGIAVTMYKDENNIWIGTSKGLLQSSLKTALFKINTSVINEVKKKPGLVSYNYGVYENKKLWIACLGAGLFCLDTTNNNVYSFFDNNITQQFSRQIISTQVLNAGSAMWLFSVYGPVEVNIASKKMGLISGLNKDSSFDRFANYPMKDSKGNIWTTLPDGISKYNIATNTFTNYKTKIEGGKFPLLRASPKTEDAEGNIWMARQDTLVKYNIATENFSTFLLRKNGKALRPVTAIASDGGDILYISVAGAFAIYHVSTGNIELFTKQTGIISTAINDLVSDKDGNAWIATESGLVFYDRQKKKFFSFTKADGLPDDDVKAANFADSEKKILFIGFEKTYCLFDPQNFLTQKKVPENIITGLEVNGEQFFMDTNKTFTYNQNNISFTYTGINYNEGQQNNYACMLEGFDKDWKYTGTERKINYVNLPANKYTFKIKSANHQGEWNENVASFSFEITPPFWQEWWFKGLVICAAVFSIYYLIKRREAAMQRTNDIKLQMSELRMQALRAQMNPHFIFNSLNSIQNYILNNNTIDAAGYLSKFAKLMRRILDQSKHNFLPLGEVLETLKMYIEIEAFRFNNEFTYTFNVANNDDELLDVPVPPMLLQPFVENAILHGLMPREGTKKLLISCNIINKAVEIIIDDNGVGRTQHAPKAGHTSQGEKLTSGMLESLQQIKNIKASIEIIDKTENEKPAGTLVKIIIPFK